LQRFQGLDHPISTTFRWYDATRHRRPQRPIRRRLWTRPCGKVAVERGVPHHTDGDQDHKRGWPQPREHPHVRPLPSLGPLRHGSIVERGRRATHPHLSRTGHTQQTEADRAIGLHYSANGTESNRGPICLERVVWQRRTLFFCCLRAGAGRVRAVGLGIVGRPSPACGRWLGYQLVPWPGKRGLARLTPVPGAGDDGSLSGGRRTTVDGRR